MKSKNKETYRCWIYVEAKDVNEAIELAEKNIRHLGSTKLVRNYDRQDK